MSRSLGTGYPIHFECRVARSYYSRDSLDQARVRKTHHVSLTGLMKWPLGNGKGHPRKSWVSFQWKCSCGATGWSQHKDLERMAVKKGMIDPASILLQRPRAQSDGGDWARLGSFVRCDNCERCTWNPGPDCGKTEHPHCDICGHCRLRHTVEA